MPDSRSSLPSTHRSASVSNSLQPKDIGSAFLCEIFAANAASAARATPRVGTRDTARRHAMRLAHGARRQHAILEHASPVLGSGLGKIGQAAEADDNLTRDRDQVQARSARARPGAPVGAGRGALIATGGAARGALISVPERPCRPWHWWGDGRAVPHRVLFDGLRYSRHYSGGKSAVSSSQNRGEAVPHFVAPLFDGLRYGPVESHQGLKRCPSPAHGAGLPRPGFGSLGTARLGTAGPLRGPVKTLPPLRRRVAAPRRRAPPRACPPVSRPVRSRADPQPSLPSCPRLAFKLCAPLMAEPVGADNHRPPPQIVFMFIIHFIIAIQMMII